MKPLFPRPASRRSSRPSIETLENRQLLSASPTPFHCVPFQPGQTIEAEDFDNGGEGVAYHDSTPADLGIGGRAYRNTAVDIQVGGSNGYDVGYATAGEWLCYTMKVPAAGTYRLQASVANPIAGGAFHVEFDQVNKTGSMAVPATGDWQKYQTITSNAFTLNAGVQVMRVYLDRATTSRAVGNFDWFKLVAAPTPVTLSWTQAAPSPVALAEAQTATTGGKMYVFGGYNITSPNYLATSRSSVYDPATNTWARIADMPQPLTHMGVAADDRYIYVAGGYVTNLTTRQQTFASVNVWRYDTITNSWSAYTSLPAPRGAGALVRLGRELHFFGGVDTHRAGHTEHWILNLDDASPHWTAAAPMPFSRNHLAAVVLDDRIYAIGGQEGTDDKQPSPDVLVYWDPSHPNAWSHVADLPAARSHMGAIATNDHIIVMAGEGIGGAILSSVVEYSPTTNTWTPMTSMPAARLAPVATYINGRIVFTTGYLNTLQATTWVSNPID